MPVAETSVASTAALVQAWIEEFLLASPSNRLQAIDGSPIFESPLVAFADGDDALFTQYKQIIGPFHLTPREALEYALAQQPQPAHVSLETVRVITWILPIARETRLSNREQTEGPSQRWAHTRHYGELCNEALRRRVVARLQQEGYLAIAPGVAPLFKVHREGVAAPPASNWSERHVAYAAGLGTFSLNDGFITERGMAMRCGSVVTNLPLPVSLRQYKSHVENCPYLMEGSCGVCMERCPAGAITPAGHDKQKCGDYQVARAAGWRAEYGVSGTVGCGLCQTGVPCEECIPARGAASTK
jgi:epoxyqueuosine reductase